MSVSAEVVTASVEQIATATEHQSPTMVQISGVSMELSQNTQQLRNLIAKFKV